MPRGANRAERQIRKNIKRELAKGKPERTESPADALLHILAAITCIMLPIALVAIVSGVVFRVPDFMTLEISRSEILTQMEIKMRPDDITADIFNFINHKNEMLTSGIFPAVDEANLERIRGLLDKILIPSVSAFILSVSFCIILRAAGRQRYLKTALKGSIIIYICAVLFVISLALFWPFRHLVFSWQPGIEYVPGSVLLKLMGGFYPLISASAIVLISFIIYIALYSVLLKLTVEEEKIFK